MNKPEKLPAMFDCLLKGQHPAIGVVFPNGIVVVMPDAVSCESGGPCIWDGLLAMEQFGQVSEVRWEWTVTRDKVPDEGEI